MKKFIFGFLVLFLAVLWLGPLLFVTGNHSRSRQ